MWGAKRVPCCRVGRSGVLCLLRSRSRVAGLLPLRHPGSTDLSLPLRDLTCALAFTGTFEHNLDAKNRLTIPSKFRADLSKGVFLSRAMDNCVSLYPAQTYTDMAEQALRRSAIRSRSRAGSCGGCSTATPWRRSWIPPAA